MKKSTKRLLGKLFAAGALGALGTFLFRRKGPGFRRAGYAQSGDVWARPNMRVTFRAELMPGKDGAERTFRVKQLLPSGRVLLHGVAGEHAEKEFEPIA